MNGSLFLTQPTIRDYTATREDLLDRAGQVLGWLSEGSLRVQVGGRYRLEDARRFLIGARGRDPTESHLITRGPRGSPTG